MTDKNVQETPAQDDSYFAKDLFLASEWIKRSTLQKLSMPVYRALEKAGWIGFAEWEGVSMLESYAKFWSDAKVVDDGIVGFINDKQFLVNVEAIVAINKGNVDGVIYQTSWNAYLDEKEIDTLLYGKPRTSDVTKFLRAGNLIPECMILHNLLFNIFTPRVGSRDNISNIDRFCLYHLMKENLISLPHIIMDYWIAMLKGRNLKRKSSVPYLGVFAKIILNQGFDAIGCEWYHTGTEIKQGTFSKMHLYLQPLTKNEEDEIRLNPDKLLSPI